ncbi:MAG TPA: hypothetical protein VE178_11620 [Silvibacterium sp.]|jgi:hypothetical protein|nr:hypothetical protein [Silvibacterium sp.]
MKKITVTALLALAGLVSAGSALAQSRHEVRASVPFEFSVGNKVLPAGNYTFDSESGPTLTNAVLIQNVDQPKYSVLVRGVEAPWEVQPIYVAQHTRLVFDNYSGEHFLREVRGPLAAVNVEIPKSKAEQGAAHNQIASTSGPGQTTIGLGQ